MVLVRERGRAMAEAAALTPTGMTAVLGGDPTEVLAAIDKHGLTAANNNAAGQVVAAGTMEQLAALKADPPAKARLIPLSVAGAFHTEHMAPAVDTLARYARAVSVHDPRTRLISNRDGEVVADGREVLERIVTQVSNPVRWDLCMQTMGELGVTGVIEVPPAGTLTDLIKRALPGVETVALKTPDDLDAARDLVAATAARRRWTTPPPGASWWPPPRAPSTSPTAGIGTDLAPGATVATLVTSRDERPVVAPHGGTVVEWLVEDGDPVAPGPAPDSAPPRGGALHEPHQRAVGRRSTPASWVSAATAPSGSSPTRRSASASTPPTSGSGSAPASSHVAGPRPTSPSSTCASPRAARPSPRRGSRPTQIGSVIVATVTHPLQTPRRLRRSRTELGATRAAAFDVSAACAGFCHGVAMANDMVRGGSADHVLVIGSRSSWTSSTPPTARLASSSPTGPARR